MTDKAKKTTPMMEQYNRLKEEYADAILFLDWAIFMKCSMRMP